MSAILSADDLNDFISPGVACIKPVETLPKVDASNPYEVTTEDKIEAENPAPASISLTDCLACSGCVTSAEAVLISLQSHVEVLHTLDAHPAVDLQKHLGVNVANPASTISVSPEAKIFVASVAPQVRASIAAVYGISERRAGYLIEQFLSGPQGLRCGGKYKNAFSYVVDTNRLREACLVLGADEVTQALSDKSRARPVLSSACPGWVCYAEKTHPHVLPHLSAVKSPQALSGTLIKSTLSKVLGISSSHIWHLAIMPCFDKKLEASREELTDRHWSQNYPSDHTPTRDVDCVITSRELLTLAEARNIQLSSLPMLPLIKSERMAFPEERLSHFLFPPSCRPGQTRASALQPLDAGPSGGYLYHLIRTYQALHPNSQITTSRGRNADVVEYTLTSPGSATPILRCARFYGFRNIQNLVRKLKPPKAPRLPGATRRPAGANLGRETTNYDYVEVMACPGGCTNGGGQVKIEDVADIIKVTRGEQVDDNVLGKPGSQREWLARVDEAYFSMDSEDNFSDTDYDASGHPSLNKSHALPSAADTGSSSTRYKDLVVDGINSSDIYSVIKHWSTLVDVPLETLAYTTFRKVESDVGKKSAARQMDDSARIAAIAGLQGGGW